MHFRFLDSAQSGTIAAMGKPDPDREQAIIDAVHPAWRKLRAEAIASGLDPVEIAIGVLSLSTADVVTEAGPEAAIDVVSVLLEDLKQTVS